MYNWEIRDPYMTAWMRLRQATEVAVRAMEIALGKQRTTLSQMDVLLVLSLSQVPLSPGQIASYVFREKHTVSALLTRMQRAGFVRKVRSKKDQRVVKIQIQPKAKEALEQAMSVLVGYPHDLLASRFSEPEIKQFDRHLKGLRDAALQGLGTKAKPLPPTVEWQPRYLSHQQAPARGHRPILTKVHHRRITAVAVSR